VEQLEVARAAGAAAAAARAAEMEVAERGEASPECRWGRVAGAAKEVEKRAAARAGAMVRVGWWVPEKVRPVDGEAPR
jgi:hypothetical protein